MSDETEEAFDRAVAGYDLFGETLRPYSESRKDAAELMGLQYPYLSTEDHDRLTKTNRYPAMKRDAAIVLWLCSIKDSMDLTQEDVKAGEWTPERAFLHPAMALETALAWINSKEWGNTSRPKFVMACGVMVQIVMDDFNSAFKLDVELAGKVEKKRESSPSPAKRKLGPGSQKSHGTV